MFGWVFGVQLGLRQTQAPIKTTTIRRRVPPDTLLFRTKLLVSGNAPRGTLLLILLVLISACVCRRPSWTPKTQPNDSSAVVWLSCWCSIRLLMSVKKCLSYRRKTCTLLHLVLWELFKNSILTLEIEFCFILLQKARSTSCFLRILIKMHTMIFFGFFWKKKTFKF